MVEVLLPGTDFRASCPREHCCEMLDFNGDYLLQCKHGLARISRHDAPVHFFSFDLSKALRHPFIESRIAGMHCPRQDTRAWGSSGGQDFYYLTFANPLAQSRRTVLPFTFLTSLFAVYANKKPRYKSMGCEEGCLNMIMPCNFQWWWLPSEESQGTLGFISIRSALLQRHAPLSLSSNATSLSLGNYIG